MSVEGIGADRYGWFGGEVGCPQDIINLQSMFLKGSKLSGILGTLYNLGLCKITWIGLVTMITGEHPNHNDKWHLKLDVQNLDLKSEKVPSQVPEML